MPQRVRRLLVIPLLVVAGFVLGCGEKAGKRIILLNNNNSPFWDACRAGLDEAAKDLKIKDADMAAVMEVNAEGSAEGQITKLRQFGQQSDIVAVAISPIVADNAAIADEMRSLKKNGVVVICVDSDIAEKYRDARDYYIGTDNVKGGRQLAIAARGLLPEGGEYVQFVGRTGAQNAIERMDGFKEELGDKYKELDRMGDDSDRDRARNNVRNAITNFPEIDMLVGIWSYNAPAIVDVVRDLKRDELTVVTFDAEPIAVRQMGDGHIEAMVVQNPFDMGYQTVRLCSALVKKDDTTVKEMFPNKSDKGGDVYETGLKVVVPSDESPLKSDKFTEKSVEFLTLDEFKKWLDKYKLTGS